MKHSHALAPLALLAPLAALTGMAKSPESTTAAVRPASGLTYADLLLESPDEIRTCTLKVGSRLLQIEEIVYGINKDGELTVAYVEGIDEDGEFLFMDNLEKVTHVFDSIDEIGGVYYNVAGKRVWAERVTFGRLPNGRLSTISYDGFADFGLDSEKRVGDPVPLCNTASDEVECVSDDTNPCTHQDGCKDPVRENGQIICDCHGSPPQACDDEYTQVCPSNGLCPKDEHCDNDPNDPSKCKCHPD